MSKYIDKSKVMNIFLSEIPNILENFRKYDDIGYVISKVHYLIDSVPTEFESPCEVNKMAVVTDEDAIDFIKGLNERGVVLIPKNEYDQLIENQSKLGDCL